MKIMCVHELNALECERVKKYEKVIGREKKTMKSNKTF